MFSYGMLGILLERLSNSVKFSDVLAIVDWTSTAKPGLSNIRTSPKLKDDQGWQNVHRDCEWFATFSGCGFAILPPLNMFSQVYVVHGPRCPVLWKFACPMLNIYSHHYLSNTSLICAASHSVENNLAGTLWYSHLLIIVWKYNNNRRGSELDNFHKKNSNISHHIFLCQNFSLYAP